MTHPVRLETTLPRQNTSRPILAVIGLLTLAACGIRPEPLTDEANVSRARADRAVIAQNYVPLDGPLSLGGAIARALKYNYDSQLAQAEIGLQEKQLDLAMAQMLPRLATQAGYNWRNNPNAAESINVRTREQSLAWSYSEQPERGNADITFSWNALDLGVSYFQAKQQGWRALIAVERRRKVIDNIVKTTAQAYWRASAAERMLPKIDPMLAEARRSLVTSQKVAAQSLQNPMVLLDFQQNMIIVLAELEKIRNDMAAAQVEITSLINVPPGSRISYSTAPEDMHPAFAIDNHKLEDIGLAMRPELRIEAYQQHIDRQDIYKEILKMMPGVGVFGSLNYDSNNLLYKNTWGELGVRATFNLFNMVQGPRAIAVAEKSVELDEQRRIALSVALLGQINLSVQEYANALDSYKTAEQMDRIGQQVGRVADNVTLAGVQTEADRVRRQLTVLTTRINRDKALARVHGALTSVYSSVGVDLVPAGADLNALADLTKQVEAAIRDWQSGRLPELPMVTAAVN